MKYNNNNLIVSSNVTQLEDELLNLENEINNFKSALESKFIDLDIEISENTSLLEAINNLKRLNNTSSLDGGEIYNGTAYDLENEEIKKNEIKAVVLVKPGQRIEFTISSKSHTKPANAFLTGANQFITIDWGDGTATQGYNYFCHTYESIDHDSLKPYNNVYKQAIITVKPTCYLDEEDILMPWTISFNSLCKDNVLGINVNFTGVTSEYYTPSYTSVSASDYKNLRYYYTTTGSIGYNAFLNCYRLEKIKADTFWMNENSYNCFSGCWNLKIIDADLKPEKEFTTDVNRYSMFANCYNLATIRSFDLGVVGEAKANYNQIFVNCFKLKDIPALVIDCSTVKDNSGEFFYNCMSLENPFKYLINLNMLKYAYRLFAGCLKIIEAPEELDISLAKNASYMFSGCINMKVPPKRLYLDSATNCSYLFENCWSMEESPLIITSNENCSSVACMFNYCLSMHTVHCDLNYPNVVNAYNNIFQCCYALKEFTSNVLRLGNNNSTTSYADNARYVFPHSVNLTKLPKQEMSLRYFDMASSGCNRIYIEEFPAEMNFSIKGGNSLNRLTCLGNVQKLPTIINLPNDTSCSSYFAGSTGLKTIDNLTINLDNATAVTNMFQNCYNLESISDLTINAPNATNISNLFQNCYNLKTLNNVKINVKPDTAINMSYLFAGCRSLEYLPDIGVSYGKASNLNTAFQYTNIKEAVFNDAFDRVTYLAYLFQHCHSLEKIKTYIKSDVTEYGYWIQNSHSLKELDLDFELPNSSRNIFANTNLGAHLTKLKVDLHNTTYGNNAAFTMSSHKTINEIQLLNWGNNGNITLDSNSTLKKVIITFKAGVSANIYLRNGKLSAQALNDFFNNLPTVSGKTLYLKGQININECDQSIAKSKGWAINTTT